MRINKLACLTLSVGFAIMLVGCGGNTNDDINTTIVVSNDIGSVNVSIKDGSKYSLESDGDSFKIVGGDEIINGNLMSASDAELLQADSFASIDYNVISVDGQDGFACVHDNKVAHVIPVKNSDVYVNLSVDDDASVVYAAEEFISFENADELQNDVDSTEFY